MSKFSKLNWKVLLMLLAVTLMINIATAAILESAGLESWSQALILTVERLSRAGFIVLLLIGGFYLTMAGVREVSKIFPDLFQEGNKDEVGREEQDMSGNLGEIIPETRNVAGTIDDLAYRLNEIEGNRDQAILKLQDADILASTLVDLIRRTVAKARNLTKEGQALNDALDAWVSGDKISIAKAAGALNDDHIRSLMLDVNGDVSYRESVLHLIATQTGVLRSSAQALQDLSNAWIASLTDQRAKTARLSIVVDALDAARPLASINAKLIEAQGYLMMQDQPALHRVTRALPAGSQQLTGYK